MVPPVGTGSKMEDTKHSLEHEVIDGVHVVRVKTPRLDDEAALLVLEDELTEFIENVEGPPKVVINLASVEYIFTVALAKLVSYRAKIRKLSGQMALCCLQEGVLDVMKVMHFDRLFSIYKTEREARGGLQ